MKVNLMYGSAGKEVENYLNINPFADNTTSQILGSVQNIDDNVDTGEAEEVRAIDVLEYIPLPDVYSALSNWVSKLRVGGQLILGFCDAVLFAKELGNYRITITDFNKALHGIQEKPHLIKRSSHTILDICQHMTANHGVKVMSRRLNEGYATIVFERVS